MRSFLNSVFVVILLTVVAFSSNAANLLTKDAMIKAADSINRATKSKNFPQATQYYRQDTLFFQYKTVEGEKRQFSQTFKQARKYLKIMFKFKEMKLKKSEKLEEEAKLHEKNEGTLVTKYKRIYTYKGKETESIETYARIFKVQNGELIISEEHML